MHFTTIIEGCARTTVLQYPRTKDQAGVKCRFKHPDSSETTKSGAESFSDLGVPRKLRADTLRKMIAAFDSMLVSTILESHKRHLMTLRHENKTLSVIGATCDTFKIQLATQKAQPTQKTRVRGCEAP